MCYITNMTVEEAWNRGNNLVATAIVSIAGFAFAPELINETEWQFKIDDTLLFLLGIGAIAWYKKNSLRRSFVYVLFVLTALVIKIGAIVVEIKDKEDVGDDIGGFLIFLLATIFVFYLFSRAKPKQAS